MRSRLQLSPIALMLIALQVQFYDDDAKQSPKFTATMEWARKLGNQ